MSDKPKVGEPFNGFKRLVQAMGPISLLGAKVGKPRKKWPAEKAEPLVSWFAFCLFGVMQLHKGDSTRCTVGAFYLAEELGVSIDTIERATRELEKVGVIKILRPGGRRENQYEFLWSQVLAGSKKKEPGSKQGEQNDSANLRTHQPECLRKSAGIGPQICGNRSANLRSAYKEEKDSSKDLFKRSSSNSSVPSESVATERPEEEDFKNLSEWMTEYLRSTRGDQKLRPPTDAEIQAVFDACPGWSADRIKREFIERPNEGKPARFYGWFVAHGELIYGPAMERERQALAEEEAQRTYERMEREEEARYKREEEEYEANHAKIRERWPGTKRQLWEAARDAQSMFTADAIGFSEVIEAAGAVIVRVPEDWKPALSLDTKGVAAMRKAMNGHELKIEFVRDAVNGEDPSGRLTV